jgi:hypothetical protein
LCAAKESGEDEAEEKCIPVEVTEDNRKGHEPLTSVIVQLKSVWCVSLLEYQVEWAETLSIVDEMGAWIYALLARLEKPLHPDVTSTIRTLALVCSRQGRDSPIFLQFFYLFSIFFS